jgi:hypothetical protein
MLSSCLRSAVILFVLTFALSSLRAQEAVETEKSPAPAEEATPKATKSKAPEKPSKSLEETMRPEEFKAAGLDKLNEDELQHLDAYLQGYRQAAQKKASEQAKVKADEEIKKANEKAEKATEEANRNSSTSGRTKLDTLVSRVDGNIEGIKGATMIRLEDGSVWKQANKDDRYKAPITDHPTAVVMHTTFGYKMRIEGMPEFYVDPVVKP